MLFSYTVSTTNIEAETEKYLIPARLLIATEVTRDNQVVYLICDAQLLL